MNDQMDEKSRSMSFIVWLLISLFVGAGAITSQSFWMDEGNAIVKAMMPDLRAMWIFSTHMGGSEIQMPLFMLALWAWEKVATSTEYALRLINLPFLLIMVMSLRKFRFWPLVCLLSPFVLYYVGELRPYMFQMAFSSLALAALLEHFKAGEEQGNVIGLHLFFLSVVLLAATSLTAAVCSAGLVLGLLFARPDQLRAREFWVRAAVWLPLGLLVAGYYGYTLLEGYRGAVARGGGILSMGFGAYEMIGLMGLGPARDFIRSSGVSALLAGHPWLPAAGVLIAIAWVLGIRKLAEYFTTREQVALTCAFGFPVVIFMVIALLAHFSVLGRHMAPLIPALLLPLAAFVETASKSRTVLVLSVLFLGCWSVSSVRLRFTNTHSRDDYRTATSLAIKALEEGKSVLWYGDMNAPRYYAMQQGGVPMVNFIQRLESDRPSSPMFADTIFLNRPDLRFKNVPDHAKWLEHEGFTLEAKLSGFEVWTNMP